MKSLPDDPPAQIESLTVAIQVPFEPVRTDLLPNALAGCGKTQKTEATFGVRSVSACHECKACGIGTALKQSFGRVLGIGTQYGHGYAAAPSSCTAPDGRSEW